MLITIFGGVKAFVSGVRSTLMRNLQVSGVSSFWSKAFDSTSSTPVFIIVSVESCFLLHLYLPSDCLNTLSNVGRRDFFIVGVTNILHFSFLVFRCENHTITTFSSLRLRQIIGDLATILSQSSLVFVLIRRPRSFSLVSLFFPFCDYSLCGPTDWFQKIPQACLGLLYQGQKERRKPSFFFSNRS